MLSTDRARSPLRVSSAPMTTLSSPQTGLASRRHTRTPIDVMRRWPVAEPLAALLSPAAHAPWARWSYLSHPIGALTCRSQGGVARTSWDAFVPGARCPIDPSHDPLDDLAKAEHAARSLVSGVDHSAPFVGGWICQLNYELGRSIEPTAAHPGRDRRARRETLWTLLWCPSVLAHDGATGGWHRFGGDFAVLDRADATESSRRWHAGPLRSEWGRAGYERAAARTVEHIRAGDIFQANIAHRMSAAFGGDARVLAADLLGKTKPWYGAYLEPAHDGSSGALCSLSPELLVSIDGATRRVISRPMKGTRPARDGVEALRESEKDRAELVMIVDLMRNDLGRIAEVGSVRVEDPRAIEFHGGASGGVFQGVATVAARMRAEAGFADVVRAVFPAGSITGAPKVRAMQVIDQLEPEPRGAYCGSVGYISANGSAALNVCIRTATIERGGGAGRIAFPVGAGIVAQSDPPLEWEETLAKASSFASALRKGAEP